MTTFVLVPGMWIGGWAWDAVAQRLRAAGHEVHAVTLTGMAEPAPEADLETHIGDVVDVLRDLDDVVLVGHSYAGSVVTAAADRVPERVSRIVYVDTGPLPDGVSQADFQGPEEWARESSRIVDGLLPPPAELPPPLVEGFDWSIVVQRGMPQPVRTATDAVRLTGGWEKLPRTAVLSTFTVEQVRQLAAVVPPFALMCEGDWTYVELPTGHWPMFSKPAELADVLAAQS